MGIGMVGGVPWGKLMQWEGCHEERYGNGRSALRSSMAWEGSREGRCDGRKGGFGV